MAMVQTVTGPVAPSELGRVLSHEHVTLGTLGLRENYPGLLPQREEIIDICVEKLSRLKSLGYDTLMDHTTFDIGRDAGLLAEVSRRSGLKIVAATGIWISPPRWFQKRDATEMVPLFVRDLSVGIAETGIRAGLIKCALDTAGMTPPLEQILRACARAQLRTRVPISTHTYAAGRSGEIQLDIFLEEGVAPSNILIGHSGDTEDLDYLRGLMDRGAFIGMDRFGIESTLSDKARAAVVAKLCSEGYSGQMLLSQDANSWSDRDIGLRREPARKNWHYFNLHENVLPRLRKLGVSEGQIGQLTGGNARALFDSC